MSPAARLSRAVVVGLGSIGRRHLSNLRRLRPDAVIAALRRPESEAVADAGCDLQLSDLSEALAFGPEAAILAGPAPGHVPLAKAFVERGVAVLIEKPLSHDLDGLPALAETARRAGVPVMIGYNLRFSPSLMALRSAVLSGEAGAILAGRAEVGQYLPDWRPGVDYRQTVSARRALGGGPLLELSHEIDYLYWLFGMPDRITCRGARLSDLAIDVADCCEVCLEYDAPRRLISVHLDFLQRVPTRAVRLIGTEATIEWDAIEERVRVRSPHPAASRTEHLPAPDRNDMYLDELTAFLDSVENGRPVPVPLDEGIDVMRIIAAASRSMESGRPETPADLGTPA